MFGQKWCVGLNKTLEPAVCTYMIDTFAPPVNRCTLAQCDERWLVKGGNGSPNPSSDMQLSMFSFLFIVFIFLPRNHLPKGSVCLSFSCVLKKTSEAFDHSFISISLAQYYVLLYGYNGTRALIGCWAGIISFYYMATMVRALWLAAERELFPFIIWLQWYTRSDWLLSGHYFLVMTWHYEIFLGLTVLLSCE